MPDSKNRFQLAAEGLANFFNRKEAVKEQPKADYFGGGGTYRAYPILFNGEKNLGEMGPIKDYYLDYEALRLRSWQCLIESEIFPTILNKFKLWVVASGLKLQSNPAKTVLKSEGIDVDSEKFNRVVESRFGVWSASEMSDYTSQGNLNLIAQEAFKNAKVGGDVLVILRYVKGELSVQLVDGGHVCSPLYGNDYFALALANGNQIRNGIELNKKGEHVAYFVRNIDQQNDKMFTFERIECRSKSTGMKVAYLVYGSKHRLNNYRGIPIIAAVLETLKKLERYKEATLGTAEEQAKVAFQIVHEPSSTGENPMNRQLAKAFDINAGGDLPKDISGEHLANTVAATTNKSVYNNTPGAEIKALNVTNGQNIFKDFYSINFEAVCAAVGIPPNVAASMYNDSFSASRAALKDWEHTINVNRDDFTIQFYKPIYDYWLHIEILKNKVQAEGYLKAFVDSNEMALCAYRTCRFTGPIPGHIDPLKEINAIRKKLGGRADNIPLITLEQAAEEMGGGDFASVIAQFSEELEEAQELNVAGENDGIEMPVAPAKGKIEKVEKDDEEDKD